mmetsp:Transcript_37047/g.106463  ORF Transcript_37047/g.106463 Transcript_37047/m.106463 type:complete len:245 (+) Transcript_37047:146-880(+)
MDLGITPTIAYRNQRLPRKVQLRAELGVRMAIQARKARARSEAACRPIPPLRQQCLARLAPRRVCGDDPEVLRVGLLGELTPQRRVEVEGSGRGATDRNVLRAGALARGDPSRDLRQPPHGVGTSAHLGDDATLRTGLIGQALDVGTRSLDEETRPTLLLRSERHPADLAIGTSSGIKSLGGLEDGQPENAIDDLAMAGLSDDGALDKLEDQRRAKSLVATSLDARRLHTLRSTPETPPSEEAP